MERMARAFAASKLFGVQNPEQALALCLVAQAEGRHPASAAQDYHIIQNRPSKKADAMLRDFLSSGGKVEWHALDDKTADATFSHPQGGTVRITWDMARATTAGLKTDMWKKYPRQMLRARVVSEGVRTVFPMATSFMYVPEEVAEFEDKGATSEPVAPKAEGKRAALPEPQDGPNAPPADNPINRAAEAVPAPAGEDKGDWNAWRLVIRAKLMKAADAAELATVQAVNREAMATCLKVLPDTGPILAELIDKLQAKMGVNADVQDAEYEPA
jgi:hypothetical protein